MRVSQGYHENRVVLQRLSHRSLHVRHSGNNAATSHKTDYLTADTSSVLVAHAGLSEGGTILIKYVLFISVRSVALFIPNCCLAKKSLEIILQPLNQGILYLHTAVCTSQYCMLLLYARCGELFFISFVIFVSSGFRANLVAVNHLFVSYNTVFLSEWKQLRLTRI